MLAAGFFSLIDIALLLGFIALILYILALTAVLPWTGGAIHILIVLAVICLIAWASLLPWNYNPPVLATLIVAQVVAVLLFVINVRTARRQRRTLNYIQVCATLCHTLNQAWFLLQHLGRDLPCWAVAIVGGVLYQAFEIPALHVIIYRSTCLLGDRRRRLVRGGMYGLLAGASTSIALSNVFRMWDQRMLNQGVCSSTVSVGWNVSGKCYLVVVYLWILVIFLMPLLRHLRKMQRMQAPPAPPTTGGSQAGSLPNVHPPSRRWAPATAKEESQRQLRAVVHALFRKIIAVIATLVLTCILSAAGVFGNYSYIAFSLQNTAMVYASTLSLEPFGIGPSTVGNASTEARSTFAQQSGSVIQQIRSHLRESLPVHSDASCHTISHVPQADLGEQPWP
ncbi:hypothetical protein RI367_002595 [Sorochytrium milnesiophthora]